MKLEFHQLCTRREIVKKVLKLWSVGSRYNIESLFLSISICIATNLKNLIFVIIILVVTIPLFNCTHNLNNDYLKELYVKFTKIIIHKVATLYSLLIINYLIITINLNFMFFKQVLTLAFFNVKVSVTQHLWLTRSETRWLIQFYTLYKLALPWKFYSSILVSRLKSVSRLKEIKIGL